ncbi:MAG: DUF6385 domain-containing protein [Bacillota bacterium]
MSTASYYRPYSLHFRCPAGCPCSGCATFSYWQCCPYHQPCFISLVQYNLPTRDQEVHSKTIDLSRVRTFSILVINNGLNPVVAQPELSPDMQTWDSLCELPYVIQPGEKRIFVLQFFLRYARIKCKNENPGQDSSITVWFQGQS